MNKNNIKTVFLTIAANMVLFAGCMGPNHLTYTPGTSLTPKQKAAVDALNDSTLNARIGAYMAYSGDYLASNKQLDKKFGFSNNYSSLKDKPMFAGKLNVKNPAEYSKFLYRFERDSIEARYIELAKNLEIQK